MEIVRGEGEGDLNKDLAVINKRLATARERLASYEALLGREN